MTTTNTAAHETRCWNTLYTPRKFTKASDGAGQNKPRPLANARSQGTPVALVLIQVIGKACPLSSDWRSEPSSAKHSRSRYHARTRLLFLACFDALSRPLNMHSPELASVSREESQQEHAEIEDKASAAQHGVPRLARR